MNHRLRIGGLALNVLLLALLLGVVATNVLLAQYSITPQFPAIGTASISDYLGKDQKLKPVSGQSLLITGPAGAEVTLSVAVNGAGVQGVGRCNSTIASATTRAFPILGGSRSLTASDFTGTRGIGISTSSENQGCIDDLAEKVTQGVGTIPAGRYSLDFTLNDARTGAVLATAQHVIEITSASVTEISMNLVSPANGEILNTTNNISFQFDAGETGKLFVYEHSNPGQSAEDATRAGGLLVLEAPFASRGSSTIAYIYPGPNARRPLQVGRKYSWGIEVQIVGGGGQRQTRRSTLHSFTVSSNDPGYLSLLGVLNTIGDPVSSTFANLSSSGYTLALSASNPIYLDEGQGPRRIDITEVLTRLQDAARRGLTLKARVE